MCNALNIPIRKEVIKGTHSFRRNSITEFVNNSDGDVELAALVFGNSPEVIRNHYMLGADLKKAREVLEKRQIR